MRQRVTIGTRASKLAVIQAQSVLSALRAKNPDAQFELVKIATEGDLRPDVSLSQIAGQGVFVRALEKALLDNRIDIAVHSLKDVPVEVPPGLCIAAVTERADPHDVLVSESGRLSELVPGARIGTGSQRRAVQLKALRSDLTVSNLRGNVETRVGKVRSGALDAVILAAAGIMRLGLEDTITEYLSLDDFLPPPGQGALGVEIRSEDGTTAAMVTGVDHQPTRQGVSAERAFLAALGGGCQAPIAAFAIVKKNVIEIKGMVADADGHTILRDSLEGEAGSAVQVGRELAQKMLARGAGGLLR